MVLYNDKKVPELRELCIARRLLSTGNKPALIDRLIKSDQRDSLVKIEENEMQLDVAVPLNQQHQQRQQHQHQQHQHQQHQQQHQHQQLQLQALNSESGHSHETLSDIKYEYEPTLDAMATEEIPASEELALPQQILEQQRDIPANVEMPNEYSESINPARQQQQQQISHPPIPSSTTSPTLTHTYVSSSSSNNSSLEQNLNNQTQPFEHSAELSPTYPRDEPQCEIDRDLLARLISERKYGTQNLYSLSRGIMLTPSRPNGIPYSYDLLLEIVQGSLTYRDGEIPIWLKDSYDTTFGTTYFEPECTRDPGIPVEDLFLNGF